MNDLITVIVPVYNVENYLKRCVNSIIKQTYQNIEIILSDDGSTDSSGFICDELAKEDKRIKTLHYENRGLSEARNRGIREAKGKYICFIDSDDWVDENYVLKLYYALRKTNSDIAECRYKRVSREDEFGEINGNILEFNTISALSLICDKGYEKHIVAWNKLYKKELFNDILYPVGKLHEDEFTTYKLLAKARKFCIINDQLYYYFQNQQSIMSSKINFRRLDAIDAFVERINYFLKINQKELADKTSQLLFKLFCDFSSLSKDRIYDVNNFIRELNKKFYSCRLILKQGNLDFIQRFYFIKAHKNVMKLKKCNKAIYYFGRLKTKLKIRHFGKIFHKKPSFIKKIKEIRNDNLKICLILSSVEYLNYGDLAICEAMKNYLLKFFNVVEISQNDTLKYFKNIVKIIRKEDVICLPGGGNIGDVWRKDEDIRRKIIKSFPKNKIIIFPQSINFLNQNDKYFLESLEIYNNPLLTLCVRDFESLEKAKNYYKKLNCILVPDTVFLLDFKNSTKIMDKIALCLRDDKEQSVNSIKKSLEIIDALECFKKPIDIISTVSNGNTSLSKRNNDVISKINEISSYKLVVTDRLHCIIFCAMTGTPCIALNNNNNKIKTFIESWLPNSKNVFYLDKNDKIEQSIFNQLNDYKYREPINLKDKFIKLEKVLNEYSKV